MSVISVKVDLFLFFLNDVHAPLVIFLPGHPLPVLQE